MLCCYLMMGSEVFYGSEEMAEKMLSRVKGVTGNDEYRIFWIDEDKT